MKDRIFVQEIDGEDELFPFLLDETDDIFMSLTPEQIEWTLTAKVGDYFQQLKRIN